MIDPTTPTASPDAEALARKLALIVHARLGSRAGWPSCLDVAEDVLAAGWTPPAAKPDTALAGGDLTLKFAKALDQAAACIHAAASRIGPGPTRPMLLDWLKEHAPERYERLSAPPPPSDDRGADAGAGLSAEGPKAEGLPPLPSPAIVDPGRFGFGFSPEQMRAYALAARTVSPVSEGALRETRATLQEMSALSFGVSGQTAKQINEYFNRRADNALAALPTAKAKPVAEGATHAHPVEPVNPADLVWVNLAKPGAGEAS